MKLFLPVLAAFLLFAEMGQAAPVVTVRAGLHDRYDRLVFDWPQKSHYTLKQDNGAISLQFDVPGTANLKPALAAKPAYIRNLQQANGTGGLLVTFQIPVGARIQAFATGNKLAFDVLRLSNVPVKFSEAPQPATPEKPVPSSAPDIVQGPQTTMPANADIVLNKQNIDKPQTLADLLANKPPEQELQPTNKPPIAATPALAPQMAKAENTVPAQGTWITLVPNKLTRLAAFVRAGRFWLVVDNAQRDLMPQVNGEHADVLKNATRIDMKDATGFVFNLPDVIANDVLTIRRDGHKWQIGFNPGDAPYLPGQIVVTTASDENGPHVTLYAGENPQVISAKDSSTGDQLWIVPMRSPDGRMVQPLTTPAYQILKTAMGAVIVPKTADLHIATGDDLVVLKAAAGKFLPLSDDKDRAMGIQDAKALSVFQFPAEDKKFIVKRQEIERQIITAKNPAQKQILLLELAHHYVDYGFGTEAVGLLRVAQDQDPKVEAKTEFRALRGMAKALAGDNDAAKQDLSGDDLQYQPLAKLWQGYSLAQANQWQEARAAFAESANSEKDIPDILRNKIILAKAETAIETNDLTTAEQEIKKIKDRPKLESNEQAAYDYVRATMLINAGKKDDGLEIYSRLMQSADRLYRVKAELNYTKIKLKDKQIKLPEAIERLERLRYSWRGDRLEIDILRQLGQYYVANKNYMQALTVWRQAASLSHDVNDTDKITQDMQAVFAKLYVDGAADKLPPLQALAIFDRFRELTPSGDAGLKAQLHLADRMIAVDLLDQADTLLEMLLQNQAKGKNAVTIGTKLANIRLLNKNSSGALKALDESEIPEAMDDKVTQRRLFLRARALADTGRTNDALALLAKDEFPEGLSLKADILWRQNRWSEAVVVLEQLATNYRDQGQNSVDGPVPNLVMKMAIAMAIDNNQKGLDLLVAEYGDYMKTTSRAAAFALIANPAGNGSLADLQTLKHDIGQVELFEQFLKKFKS